MNGQKKPVSVLSIFDENLLIDDTKELFNRGESYLFTTHFAKSLSEATVLAKKIHFDAIVIDIDVNSTSSFDDIICEAKNRFPTTPIIATSASEDRSVALECLKCGACDFLSKKDISPGAFVHLERSILFAMERARYQHGALMAKERLEKANLILSGISDISKKLLIDADVSPEEVLTVLGSRVPTEDVFMFLYDAEDEDTCSVYTVKKRETGSEEDINIKTTTLSQIPNNTAIRRWIQKGVPIRSNVSKLPEHLIPLGNTLMTFGPKEYVYLVPIAINGEPWGIVGYPSKEECRWSVEEVDAIASISRLISIVIYQGLKETKTIQMIEEKFAMAETLISGSGG